MNFKLVLRIVGFSLLIEAAAMVLPLAVSLIYGEDPAPFLYTIAILLAVGCAAAFLLKGKNNFFAREGFFTGPRWSERLTSFHRWILRHLHLLQSRLQSFLKKMQKQMTHYF